MFLAYLPLGCVEVLFIHPCTLYWFTGVTKLHPARLLGIIILLDDSKNIKIDAAKSIPKFKEKTTLKYKTYLPKLSQTLLWFMSRKFGFPFMSGVKKRFQNAILRCLRHYVTFCSLSFRNIGFPGLYSEEKLVYGSFIIIIFYIIILSILTTKSNTELAPLSSLQPDQRRVFKTVS